MAQVGSDGNPLRVAIIGAGPTGFYTADALFKEKKVAVEVDIFDRLPTPFGLVRGGVAPDHQKIKSVTKAFDRTAKKPAFRFYGNVEFGTDITLDEMKQYYHQIVFTNGAQTDRNLNIPGEELHGSHAATEFVAWYNGHPDYRHLEFDLTQEKVAVIGVGNVAVDVCRILSRTPEELAETDIANYALEALRESNVKEVYMLGRRGPAQAAFTTPEIRELGELQGADAVVLPEEAALDPLSQQDLEEHGDRTTRQKVEILQNYAERGSTGKPRKLIIRFLVSPTEIHGDDNGHVNGMTLVKNELYLNERGTLRPRSTDQFEKIDVGLVFRSVGYRGVPLPDVPFHEQWGIIPNARGRVLVAHGSDEHVTGLYTGGWIKRGPSGVIGTNKPDAVETVACMLEDMAAGKHLEPSQPSVEAAAAFIEQKQPNYFSYDDWLKLDALEVAKGEAQGRPRVKFTSVEEMMAALGRT